ncbi:hypothetical protein V2G26_009087 [Clonostachys chloroleuca]
MPMKRIKQMTYSPVRQVLERQNLPSKRSNTTPVSLIPSTSTPVGLHCDQHVVHIFLFYRSPALLCVNLGLQHTSATRPSAQ